MLCHTADTFLLSAQSHILQLKKKKTQTKPQQPNNLSLPNNQNLWVNAQQYVQYVISWFRMYFQMKHVQNILQS